MPYFALIMMYYHVKIACYQCPRVFNDLTYSLRDEAQSKVDGLTIMFLE